MRGPRNLDRTNDGARNIVRYTGNVTVLYELFGVGRLQWLSVLAISITATSAVHWRPVL